MAVHTAQPGLPGPGGESWATGRGEYVRATVRTLWPEPARVVTSRFPSRGGAASTEFIVVPNDRRAALLLPRRPHRAAAAALRNYKASAGTRRRLELLAFGLAARAGLGELLPSRISVYSGPPAPDADIASCLSTALGSDVLVSVYISPPRANRKPVLQVLTPGGKLIGFAKVGVSALTRELVRAEAASLEFLATVPLSHVEVPRLRWHGQWREHEVIVQEALSGSGRPRDITELATAMAEVSAVRGVCRLPAADSAYAGELRQRLAELGQRDLAGQMLAALTMLVSTAGSRQLAFGSWHGDWTPWNMTMSGGRALLWDWERFATGVPVGYDVMHYRLQGALIRDRMAPEAATEAALADAGAILAPVGVNPDLAWLVAGLYLIEIGCRYLRDGLAEAGGRLGQVGTWLIPAITRHAEDRLRPHGYHRTDR